MAQLGVFEASCAPEEVDMVEYYRVNDNDVVADRIDDDVLLINLKNGNYFHLTAVGAKIWNLLVESRGVSEVISQLLREYRISSELLTTEVKSFISQLLEESLIEPNEKKLPEEYAPSAETGEKVFQTPRLEKFSDLQEFLLLDPIHEISNLGLPSRKTPE